MASPNVRDVKPEVRRAAGRRLCPRSGFQGRLALASGQPGEHDKAAVGRCVSAAYGGVLLQHLSAAQHISPHGVWITRPPDSWGPEVPADPHWTCVINVCHRVLVRRTLRRTSRFLGVWKRVATAAGLHELQGSFKNPSSGLSSVQVSRRVLSRLDT